TGFSSGGASVYDVKLMRKAVGDAMKIKAAGGIRSAAFARELIEAGADRIGASKSVEICSE
ncbi:MAG: 2-deoxyribose-5-phosphate aldolase, partial [Synergistes sp.]|nr:2-deoxyribose-5-phosphate aldolase [Synergistes sp.]